MYIVSQDWESERFVYSDNEKEKLLFDLTDWLFDNEENRSETHLDDDRAYRAFCENQAEDAVNCAKIYGKWSVADLTVRAL